MESHNIKLAQNKPIPEPSKGQRVIIDERSEPPKPVETPASVPSSVYYWLGVIVLVLIATAAAVSFFRQNKKESLLATSNNKNTK